MPIPRKFLYSLLITFSLLVAQYFLIDKPIDDRNTAITNVTSSNNQMLSYPAPSEEPTLGWPYWVGTPYPDAPTSTPVTGYRSTDTPTPSLTPPPP